MNNKIFNNETERNTPTTLHKRIGSTTYKVNIYFSKESVETLEDKLLRLIENEVASVA